MPPRLREGGTGNASIDAMGGAANHRMSAREASRDFIWRLSKERADHASVRIAWRITGGV